jgi:hypothetical protein
VRATEVVGRVSNSTTTKGKEDSPVTVKLIVDFNKDGRFEESGSTDKVYKVAATNGRFFFNNVEIPETGTKANLIVTKDGYAPYSKILELKPEVPVNVDVSLVPAFTKVVQVQEKKRAGEKLYFTLTKSGEIRVSSGTRTVNVSDDELSLAIDEGTLPEDVTTIKVSMKTFNSADKKDIKYFPGEFKGTDPKGAGEEVGLESLTFALLDLRDQNGNPLTLNPKRADTCLYEVTQTIPSDAVRKIKEKGDFDNNTPGCQVPIYSYDYNTEGWDYLGTGTILDENNTKPECSKLDENKR